jgi:deoxyribodipyrimidine photolyase-related protein
VPLNLGLLSPSEVVTAIVETDAPLNSKEWSIRQLIGWREYIYHWFHYYADEIYSQNHFDHQKTLPAWFWKPDDLPVEMNCLTTVLKRVNRTAYSHHIERLMVIGNFCLLVWYDPTSVTQWFWEQYADAYERVVVANVMGMSQFADGGNLATKPYVASANYINKMSNYCSSCRYDPQQKYWQDACPLNYLYRRFLDNYQDTFRKSRQPFLLSHLEKLDLARIHEQSEQFVEQLG